MSRRLTRAERTGLLAVLLLALGLRVWGLGFGLPAVAHDDEWYYCATAASCLERGTVKVTTSPPYEPYMNPTGFTFLVALAELPLDASLGGPGGEGTRARYRAHRGRYHLAGRWVSALLGVLGVLATWLLARSFLGPRPALLAAALLAVAPLHVRDSHFAVCDVAAAAWMTAAVAVWRTWRTPRGAALAGVCLGVAGGTKFSAGLLAPALLLDVLFDSPGPEAPRGERARRTLLCALGAGVGVLVAFPALLLDASAFVRSFRYQAAFGKAPWPGQDPGPSWWLHGRDLLRGLGPGGLLLAAWGWLGLARRCRGGEGSPRQVALTAYPSLHLLVFLPMPLYFARLDVTLLPFLAVLAGAAVRRVRGAGAWTLIAALTLLPPALFAARIDAVLAQPETRLDLSAWLTAQVPADGDPLRVAAGAGALRWLPLGLDGLLDPRLEVTSLRGFEGPAEEAADRLLRALRARGVELVVLTDAYTVGNPSLVALRARLAAEATLAFEVHPADAPVPVAQEERYGPWDHAWRRRRPGPSVWVYRL